MIRWYSTMDAMHAGADARSRGDDLSTNPHPWSITDERSNALAFAWADGWERRDQAIKNGIPCD